MINIDKKTELENKIKKLKVKKEEVYRSIVEERENKGDSKALDTVYSKLIEKINSKQEELKALVRKMVANGEPLYYEAEHYQKELQSIDKHNKSIDLLQDSINKIDAVNRNRKELIRLGHLNNIALNSMEDTIKVLRFNLKTLSGGARKKDKDKIKAKIKQAEQDLKARREQGQQEEERAKQYLDN